MCKDFVKRIIQLNLFRFVRRDLIRLEIIVEVPNLFSDIFDDFAFFLIWCDQLIEGTLCMNPTKGMIEDIELTRIITDNDQAFGEAVMKQTTDESSLYSRASSLIT